MSAPVPETSDQQGPDPMVAAPTLDDSTEDIRRSLDVANKGVQAAQDPREAKDWAAAVLSLSQSLVILDPKLVAPQGVPIDALHPPAPRSGGARIPADKSGSHQHG